MPVPFGPFDNIQMVPGCIGEFVPIFLLKRGAKLVAAEYAVAIRSAAIFQMYFIVVFPTMSDIPKVP